MEAVEGHFTYFFWNVFYYLLGLLSVVSKSLQISNNKYIQKYVKTNKYDNKYNSIKDIHAS